MRATNFDKYQLLERIGMGGMAEVFLAKSQGVEGFEKQLVIKRILPELSTNKRFVEMFIAEARIAVALNHPNIVQIYDFGKVGEDFFIAMEFVEGWDLGYLTRLSAEVELMSVGDVIQIGMEIARGLDYAHRRQDAHGDSLGLVHCDISPQNVLVSCEGAIKIVDFGIAKATILQDDAPHVVKGKFCYMSPEQARGEHLDHRSDLFSLGVVLFELVCGRPLFKQTDREQTLSLVKSAVVPDLRDLNPAIPEAFEHVLYKLLAREPDQRYQTARELQQEMMRVLYGLGSLHDAYTLSEYIDRVGAEFSDSSSATRESGQTRTVRTNVMPRAPQNEATTAQHQVRTAELGLTPVTPAIESITDPGDRENAPLEILSRTRKEVVLIAGVLEGLFALRNEVGQDRWLQIFQEYTRMVDSIAFKNNGVVHRVNESGFVMLLGVPISSENDAERAAGVALDMQDAMSGINLSLNQPLKLAIGVAISEVILEQGALHHGQRRYNWSFLGDSHEFADQLARAGMGAEILLGSLVWRRVRREYHGVALEGVKFDIGGVTQTMQAWRLLHVKSWRERLKDVQHAYHVFHGRELELRSLRGHYRRVLMEGLASGVVVAGEQGVGKSTLVEEFLRGLDPRDVRVVRGVANTLERGTPLGGVSTLLAELMRLGPRDDVRQLRATLEMRIEALFPEEGGDELEMLLHSIGAIFGLRYTGGLFEELAGEERRKRTSLSLMKFLRRFAERKPVVLMIDDAHQLDSMTLELATQIFSSRYEAPLFLVFVMTPAAMGEFDQARWDRLIEGKYMHREALTELSTPDAHKLCVELLRGQRIEDESLVDAILHRAGGNPFYIKEVVEILRDRGVLQDSGERRQVMLEMEQTSWMPTSVEGAIAARVDRLSLGQRSLLQRVALLWSPFTWTDVDTLLDDVEVAQIESLVEEGLLERVNEHRGLRDEEDVDAPALPPAQRSYRFNNALTQEVAARTLVEEESIALHTRIADHLLAESHTQDVAELVRLAYHLQGAGRLEQAAQTYFDAAKDAFGQFGAAESLKLCDQVTEHLSPEHPLCVEVLYLKEKALREVGRVTEHKQVLDRLSERVDPLDTSRQLEVWMRLIRYHYDQAEFGAALSTIEQVRELAQQHQAQAMLARADQFEAYIRLDQGKRSEALALVESAIGLFSGLEDRPQHIPGLVSCHNMRGAILRRDGRHQEALDTYSLAMELAQERLDGDLIGRYVLVNMGLANVYLGRYLKGLECYQRCLKQAKRLGLRRDEAGVLVNMGHAYLMCGEYDRAISHVQRGVYMARKVNATVTLADGEVTLGTCYAEMGKGGLAKRVLGEGLRLAESIPHVYLALHAMLALARLTLEAEDVPPQAARVALMQAEDCDERAERAGMRWGQLGAKVLMARAYDSLGMSSRALELAALAWEIVQGGEEVGMEDAAETYAQMLVANEEIEQARHVLRHVINNTTQRLDMIEHEEDRLRFLNRPVYLRVRVLWADLADS